MLIVLIVSAKLDDGTIIRAYLRNTDCVFEVLGQPDTVVDIGEQISWISCAFRSSNTAGAVACVPTVQIVGETSQTSTTISLVLGLSAEIVKEKLAIFDEGCCWQGLFRDPLLVRGYPIAKRPEHVPGLEMSLNTMMVLTGARRITPFRQNLFIKCHSKMLVAVKEANGVVLWHAIANEDGQYIYYHDKRVQQNAPGWCDDPKPSELTTKRHVIGWWSEIKNLAGIHCEICLKTFSMLTRKQGHPA